MLRFGVLGAARIAPAALLEPAQNLPGVEVVAIASRDPQRARPLADRYGVSAERIRQIEQGAMKKLRGALAA